MYFNFGGVIKGILDGWSRHACLQLAMNQCQRSLLCRPSVLLSEGGKMCFEVEGSLNGCFCFLESGVSGEAIEEVGAGEAAQGLVLGVSSSLSSGISSGPFKLLVVNDLTMG
jgi:hypothetical protein